MDAALPPAAPTLPAMAATVLTPPGMLVPATGESLGFAALLADVLTDAVPQDGIATVLAPPGEAAALTEDLLPVEPGPTLPAALPLSVPPWPVAPLPEAMTSVVEAVDHAATSDGAQPIAALAAASASVEALRVTMTVAGAHEPGVMQPPPPAPAALNARIATPDTPPHPNAAPPPAATPIPPQALHLPPQPAAASATVAPPSPPATASPATMDSATQADAIAPSPSAATPHTPRRMSMTLDHAAATLAPEAEAPLVAAPSAPSPARSPITPEAPMPNGAPHETAAPALSASIATTPDIAAYEPVAPEPPAPLSARPPASEPGVTPPPPAPTPPPASPTATATPPALSRPTTPIPWPARQVAPFAVALALGSDDSLSLTLEPAALGRVEVEIARNGTEAQISLRAERPETLALLLRDRAELERALGGAGLGGEEGRGPSLSFGLGTGGEGQRERRPTPRETTGQPAPDQRGSTRIAAPASLPPPAAARGLLDLAI